MERITLESNVKLSGILYKTNSNSAIIISHGFASTKDRPRLIRLSEELHDRGYTVLRYDFGGCGESDNREINVANQIQDLQTAISFVKDLGYQKIGLVGESLGGLTTLKTYSKDIGAIVLYAPVTDAKEPSFLQDETFRKELKEKGYIKHLKNGKLYQVSQKYVDERLSIKPKELLNDINCPVLIIHGDNDQTVSLDYSRNALKYLPNAKLEVIVGGDHTLNDKMDEVIPLTINWFDNNL